MGRDLVTNGLSGISVGGNVNNTAQSISMKPPNPFQ